MTSQSINLEDKREREACGVCDPILLTNHPGQPGLVDWVVGPLNYRCLEDCVIYLHLFLFVFSG